MLLNRAAIIQLMFQVLTLILIYVNAKIANLEIINKIIHALISLYSRYLFFNFILFYYSQERLRSSLSKNNSSINQSVEKKLK
jgi:hypothetical protein